MSKLLLVGNNKERRQLIKKLHKAGCEEIVFADNYQNVEHIEDIKELDSVSQMLAKLEFGMQTFKDYKTEAARIVKKNKDIEYKECKPDGLLKAKPSLTWEELDESRALEEEVLQKIDEVGELNQQIYQNKSQRTKLVSAIDQLKPFVGLDMAVDKLKDAKTTSTWLGYVNMSKKESLKDLDELAVYETFDSGSTVAVVAVALKENADEVNNILSSLDWVAYSSTCTGVPSQEIENCKQQIKELDKQNEEKVIELVRYDSILPQIRQLHDYYSLEKAKNECEYKTASTVSSYVLEAWIPSEKVEELTKELEECDLKLAFFTREPKEDEIPPSYVENNAVVSPYQDVTNMFSAPSYNEIDPNPFVAFFFFVFFGMMLSDAGYGLVLTLLTGIVLAVTKPPKGQSNLIKIIFMGGISTIIWGAVFGSYFGVSAKDLGIPYWFNPIDDPMMMLFLSLGVGIFQMCFGLGINMVALIKQKKGFEGFCAAFSWYFMILGLAGGALGGKLASWVPTVGWVLFGIGLALLMIAGAIGKKGFKKVSGALSNVYGIINFFSDLMSYTRIFGLGLATAVIGMVFNQIGMVIMGLIPVKIIGVLFAMIIFLIGHVFNVGINTLGAYVHNSRLQFVEFFGKFYTGGGRLFRPLGSEMKYYYIKPKEVEKQ